ncbi:hypothetical protein E2542_SST29365 [Spatholobus suberectus]|nr:hypothetical protein E2542_SST29365 [Spatholobus suberectus]
MAESNHVFLPSRASALSARDGLSSMVTAREEAPVPTNLSIPKRTSRVRFAVLITSVSAWIDLGEAVIKANYASQLHLSIGEVVVTGDSNTVTSESFGNKGNGNQDISSVDINSTVSGSSSYQTNGAVLLPSEFASKQPIGGFTLVIKNIRSSVIVVGDNNNITKESFNNKGNGTQGLSSIDINSTVSGSRDQNSSVANDSVHSAGNSNQTISPPLSSPVGINSVSVNWNHSFCRVKSSQCCKLFWDDQLKGTNGSGDIRVSGNVAGPGDVRDFGNAPSLPCGWAMLLMCIYSKNLDNERRKVHLLLILLLLSWVGFGIFVVRQNVV